MRFFRLFIWVVLLTLAVMVSTSFAHRVNLFAVDEGGEVYTESSFAGKRPVKNGTIRVLAEDGTLLLTGTTDEKGIFVFSRPSRGILDVEVDAGVGHKGLWRLDAAGGESDLSRGTPEESKIAAETPSISKEDLKILVEASVEKAMMRAAEKQRFKDIVGGLGYIVGLFGLLAFWKSKKETA